jgi:hypothetical protein
MIKSADTANIHNKPKKNLFNRAGDVLNDAKHGAYEKKVRRYVNIPTIELATKRGANANIVGHFVAVDPRNKAVVLAVRGTYSVSGLLADAEGYVLDFCGGLAHKGTFIIFFDIITEMLVSCIKASSVVHPH